MRVLTPQKESPPSDGGGWVILGILMIIGGLALAPATDGVSAAAVIPGLLFVAAGRVIDYLCRIAHYLKQLQSKE